MKRFLIVTFAIFYTKLSFSNPVSVMGIGDEVFLAEIATSTADTVRQSIQIYDKLQDSFKKAEVLAAQAQSTAKNVNESFQTIKNTKDIMEQFAAFSNIYEGVSDFMNENVCDNCTKEQLAQWRETRRKIVDVEKNLRADVTKVIGQGKEMSTKITQLSEEIKNILPEKFDNMNPAEIAKTQARLIATLGNAAEQTNGLINSMIQMQASIFNKDGLLEKNAEMIQKTFFQNMNNQVKP